MATVPFAYPGQVTACGARPTVGFERLAMFLLPIMEAASTSLDSVPLFDGIKVALFAALFCLAALTARPPVGLQRGALRWSLLILGFYTVISRLAYLGASGAGPAAVVTALLGLPALLWLLNASLSTAAFRSIMTAFVAGAAVAGLISSGLAINVLIDSGARGWARVAMEVSSNRNSVAPIYVIALSAIMFLPLNLPRVWAAICAAIILVALLLLFSRSGYIALAVLLILAMCAGWRVRRAIVPLLVVLGVALVAPGSPILDRIDYTFEARGANMFDDSAEARIDIWQAAIADFENNPIFGSGSGKSPLPTYDVRHEEIIYSHNYFLTQLSQLGMIGFIITISSLVLFLQRAAQWRGKERYFILSFVMAIVSSSLTGEPLYGLLSYAYYVVAIHAGRQPELEERR